MKYVLVENGQIRQGPRDLPKSWKNISGFHHLSDAELISHGWFPFYTVTITLNDDETYDTPSLEFFSDRVVATQTKRLKTEDEITQENINKTQALQRDIIESVQVRLDDFARTRNYDGILSLCTYANDANIKFKTEGEYGVQARSNTWAKCYEILAEVEAGIRPIPSGFIDIVDELPLLEWP